MKGSKAYSLDSLSDAPEVRFIALHARAEGKAAPPLLASFVGHLDRVCGTVDPSEIERLRDAMVRLEREHPDLHQAVTLMEAPGAKLRLVAPTLGVSMKTVSVRRARGLARLQTWLRADVEAA